MDHIDKQILMQLQHNAAQPVADIACKVGLSVTHCWRRIQRREEIKYTTALPLPETDDA